MAYKTFRRLLIGLTFIICPSLGMVFTGCSSDDDEQQEPKPSVEAKPLEQGNDQRPGWQSPNYDVYEMTMSVEVCLQDRLQAYASANDVLCATIGGEVRGVATPLQVDEKWVFPLTVGSNESQVPVTLSYYCDSLHRIFTASWTNFDASAAPMGVGGIYEPVFVE